MSTRLKPTAYSHVVIRRRLTQYDPHRLVCSHCGMSILPPEAAHARYGRLGLLVVVLSGVSERTRREVSRLFCELFGVHEVAA